MWRLEGTKEEVEEAVMKMGFREWFSSSEQQQRLQKAVRRQKGAG